MFNAIKRQLLHYLFSQFVCGSALTQRGSAALRGDSALTRRGSAALLQKMSDPYNIDSHSFTIAPGDYELELFGESVQRRFSGANQSELAEKVIDKFEKLLDQHKQLVEVPPEEDVGPRIVLGLILGATILICGVCDTLMCCVVIRYPRMRTVVNLLLANLAFSDLLVALVAAPLFLHGYSTKTWVFGTCLCSLAGYLKNTSFHVSTNTLLAIAINRLMVVRYPLYRKLTRRLTLVLMLVIWVVSCLVALPTALYATTRTYKEVTVCVEVWPTSVRPYHLFLILTTFCLPLTLMSYSYLTISRLLWRTSTASIAPPAAYTIEQRRANERAKRRTYMKLIVVLVMFALCWAPLQGYTLWREIWYEHWKGTRSRYAIFCLVEGLAMSNAMFNALISIGINNNAKLIKNDVKRYFYRLRMPTCLTERSGEERSERCVEHIRMRVYHGGADTNQGGVACQNHQNIRLAEQHDDEDKGGENNQPSTEKYRLTYQKD